MEIKQLEYFVAIVENESISKAAEFLHMAQPPLSRQLKMMEEELGELLFDRSKKKKLVITPQGELFYKKAKEVLFQLEDSITEIKEIGKEIFGLLTVGSTTFCAPILINTLSRFEKLYPSTKFSILEGSSSYLTQKLINHQINIALTSLAPKTNEFESIALASSPCLIVANPKKFAISSKSLDLEEIANLPLILMKPSEGSGLYNQILHTFQEQGFTPNILCECRDSSMLLHLVQMGMGVSILPETVVQPSKNVATYSISKTPWHIQPFLIWRKNSYLSLASKKFIELAKDYHTL